MENISTYGWDMVFATKTSFINSKLDGGNQNFTEVFELSGQSITAKGETMGWQIAVGGSDALVNFTIPCSEMSLDNGKKLFTFKNGHCLIQTKLGLVLGEDGIHKLQIQDENMKVLQVSFPESNFSEFVSYAITAFQNWLDKLTNVDYEFASIQLNSSTTNYSGLVPTSATYAYIDIGDKDGILGLLCCLNGSSDKGNLQQVSPNAIQSGESSVLINSDIMKNLLQSPVSITTWANQSNLKVNVQNSLNYQVTLKS